MQPSTIVANAPSRWKLSIKDIRCDGLQPSNSKSSLQYYLILAIHGTKQKKQTDTTRGDSAWNGAFYFDVSDPTCTYLNVQIYAKRTLRRDKLIGELEVDISSVPFQQGEKTITQHISRKSSNQSPLSITVTVCKSTASSVVAEANKGTQNMDDAPLIFGGIDNGSGVETEPKDFLAHFAALVNNLGKFTKLVDTLAEIHPYSICAWTVLSVAYKIIAAQKSLDDSVKQLVEVLNSAYQFVQEATPLERIRSRQAVIKRLTHQTVECAYFIQEYARDTGFGTRTIKHLLDGSNQLIAEFQQNIENLKDEFMGLSTVNTEIVVLRIEDKIDDLKSTAVLDDMAYVSARCSSEKACLLGTRVNILDEIIAWVNSEDKDVQRVFWLTGVAGSGKSAIAHTIAQMFQQIKRGSSFCFDASKPAQSQAMFLYTTLSRDMAGLDSGWRTSLVDILDHVKALRTTSSVVDQFNSLFLEPCKRMSTLGPVVLVIDALDECCGEGAVPTKSAREQLLRILSTEAAILPSNFRVLLTSRPEDDIHHALSGRAHVLTRKMDAVENTTADIKLFVHDRLRNVEQLNAELPNEQWLEPLVHRSEGLFQWAFTACNFIAGKDAPAGFQPIDNWNTVLNSSTSNGLDGLYRSILDRIFQFEEGVSSDDSRFYRYRKILGRVLDIRQPLPLNALNKLGTDDERNSDSSVIIKPLGSLLRGASETDVPIQPLHTSFREFLTDKKRSGVYSISAGSQDMNLTLACLRIMQTSLRFNICNLETSYERNSEVHDLETRVRENIPTHLRYACHFWAHHLQHIPKTTIITKALNDFLSRQLLFWIEAMGLTKGTTAASFQGRLLRTWVPTTDRYLVNAAAEVARLVDMSGAVVLHHTPHLYLSVLPFVPTSSMIGTQYLHRFPRRILVHSTMVDWPTTALEFTAHRRSRVFSVAFSPDGERIVSGSDDMSIRVWDARTGEVVGGPFEGHTSYVWSVAFSPDGERIVSGSDDRTIRVWDARTGETIGRPFEGHTGSVWSVAYSPDGDRIVSGSIDSTIRVWDAHTGEIVEGPFEGHTDSVWSVAFSSDGERIVSGSDDRTIRVWNAHTGEVVGGPFEGHTDWVNSVAFSPDGERIVSGSLDNTIRVWDARSTGEVLRWPFEGHTNSVKSVAFFPDGERIISGSVDKTIRDWNPRTRKVTLGPLGRTSRSIRFVREHIASTSKVGINISELDVFYTKSNIKTVDAIPSPASLFSDSSKMINGWILGKQGEPLFWVPPEYRAGLLRPSSICVIGRVHKTRLDVSQFVHGEDWTECYAGD